MKPLWEGTTSIKSKKCDNYNEGTLIGLKVQKYILSVTRSNLGASQCTVSLNTCQCCSYFFAVDGHWDKRRVHSKMHLWKQYLLLKYVWGETKVFFLNNLHIIPLKYTTYTTLCKPLCHSSGRNLKQYLSKEIFFPPVFGIILRLESLIESRHTLSPILFTALSPLALIEWLSANCISKKWKGREKTTSKYRGFPFLFERHINYHGVPRSKVSTMQHVASLGSFAFSVMTIKCAFSISQYLRRHYYRT